MVRSVRKIVKLSRVTWALTRRVPCDICNGNIGYLQLAK